MSGPDDKTVVILYGREDLYGREETQYRQFPFGTTDERRKPAPARKAGAPGRIRTCDLRIRSPLLYPAELRARGGVSGRFYNSAGGAASILDARPA